VEQTRANNGVSPAVIELLIRERSKGKTLRQLGQTVGRSHERIRQILAKHNVSEATLLTERGVAAKLGYPVGRLMCLRKEGTIKPIKPAHRWLYSQDQVRQISSIIAERRRCERCGEPRPLWSHRFCRECRQYREEAWMRLSPEKKAEHLKNCMALQKDRENDETENKGL